ncbi:MAG: hypothetical protein GY780_00515 [bacterium]|nr:hypothetical protein [bacterium]
MRGFTAKFFSFLAVATFMYIAFVALLSNVSDPLIFNGKTYSNLPLNRPNGGLSVLRFREAENFGKVDVVFLGSSHCYRTFDTQYYRSHDVRAFNLGSSAQGPVISLHIAKKYFPVLDPDLVVLEVYCETLRSSGAESLLDQLSNRPTDFNLLEMTAAVGGVKAWNGWLIHLLNFTDESTFTREPDFSPNNGHYVNGGFVRRESKSGGIAKYDERPGPVNPNQLKHMEKLIQIMHEQKRPIILVSQPLPRATLKAIDDFHQVQKQVAELAARHNVPFYDFNGLIEPRNGIDLHDESLFYDYHHLNGEGVAAFNPVFLDLLRREGWL